MAWRETASRRAGCATCACSAVPASQRSAQSIGLLGALLGGLPGAGRQPERDDEHPMARVVQAGVFGVDWRFLALAGVVFGVTKFHCGMERISSANRWPPWPLLYLGLAAPTSHIPPSPSHPNLTPPPLHPPPTFQTHPISTWKFHALAHQGPRGHVLHRRAFVCPLIDTV